MRAISSASVLESHPRSCETSGQNDFGRLPDLNLAMLPAEYSVTMAPDLQSNGKTVPRCAVADFCRSSLPRRISRHGRDFACNQCDHVGLSRLRSHRPLSRATSGSRLTKRRPMPKVACFFSCPLCTLEVNCFESNLVAAGRFLLHAIGFDAIG